MQIKHKTSGKVLCESDAGCLKDLVFLAIRRGTDLRGADFRYGDFHDAEFNGAYFRGADLRGADLRGAIFFRSNADLSDCDLRGADFQEADLSGAYLCGADLRGTNFRNSNLSDTDFSGATLDNNTNFDGANVCGAKGLVIGTAEKQPQMNRTSRLLAGLS